MEYMYMYVAHQIETEFAVLSSHFLAMKPAGMSAACYCLYCTVYGIYSNVSQPLGTMKT